MPLSKSFPTPFNVNATYWVVARGDLDFANGKVWLQLNGYADKALHDSGAQWLLQKTYTVNVDPAAALPIPSSGLLPNVTSYLESLAMAQADFNGASVVA